MSRVGKKPVSLPQGVEITVEENNVVTVKGPKGELKKKLPSSIKIDINEDQAHLLRPSDKKEFRGFHGLARALLANMVEGVTEGFSRTLELVGVGYRATMQGQTLVLNVGYSQPVNYVPREGIEIEVPESTKIVVKGIDKEVVGNTAAEIRGISPPDPYKGKGIRYQDEEIRRKAGKAAK